MKTARAKTALLTIDLINDMAFEGAEAMAETAPAVADVVLQLRAAADRLGVPVIYVNDNYGHWHSERSRIVDYCRGRTPLGRRLADTLAPRDDDYFVIKPQFSGFYATNLPVLLPRLGVQRLMLTGIAADICVLFTAADAHMRDYEIWAPADAVGSCRREHAEWALNIMAKSMSAKTQRTSELSLAEWMAASER
jgi:nicotinamidase-related amidase